MIREIYRVRIQKLVKDYVYFQSFATEAQAIITELNAKIDEQNGEIEDIVYEDEFTPHEKQLMINDRLYKVEELATQLSTIYAEVTERYNKLNTDRNILIETFTEENPELSPDLIQQEIDEQIKKHLQ
jgi:hypothetical protein